MAKNEFAEKLKAIRQEQGATKKKPATGAPRHIHAAVTALPLPKPAAPQTGTQLNPGEYVEFFNRSELPMQNVADLFSETRTAWVFVEFVGKKLRFCRVLGFLAYDGRRFIVNPPGGANPFFEQFLKEGYRQALLDQNIPFRPDLLKGLSKLEARKKREAVIALAENNINMIVEPHELDSDPMLLNVRNGTIDLRTGKLRPHCINDKITRIVNIEYRENEQCPYFSGFLYRIFDRNDAVIEYVRRLFGYCLTGRTDEQVLSFWHGLGANGKTTLLNVLSMLLGDFASPATADLLMQRDRSRPSNDVAALRGSRLVKVSEFNENEKLDEAAVKTLNGGDEITCRFLHKEFFSYYPMFKIILLGNHKPKIRGNDEGIWRRIHLLPFNVTIPKEERDPTLMDKLKKELPGILAWAVRGCSEWQRIGLAPPQEVLAATEEFRAQEDVFNTWISECCKIDLDLETPAAKLITSFSEYSGWKNITPTRFGRMLGNAGFLKKRGFAGVLWSGIGLNN